MAIETEVVGLVARIVAAVEGVCKVEVRLGGKATWGERPRALQDYWVVRFTTLGQRPAAIGTVCWEQATIQVEGWMPWSRSNPDSLPAWNGRWRGVMEALRGSKALRALVGRIELPQVGPDEVVLLEGDEGPGVVCHHTVIELRVRRYVRYTVE